MTNPKTTKKTSNFKNLDRDKSRWKVVIRQEWKLLLLVLVVGMVAGNILDRLAG